MTMGVHLLPAMADRSRSSSPKSRSSATFRATDSCSWSNSKLSGRLGMKNISDYTTSTVGDVAPSTPSSSTRTITKKTNPREGDDDNDNDNSCFRDHGASNLVLNLASYDDDLRAISNRNTTDVGNNPQCSVLSIDREDVSNIYMLGRGQFCHVHLVSCVFPPTRVREVSSSEDETAPPCRTKKRQFACKSIDPERIGDEHEMIIAATDLAREAKILSELDHPNVIKLQGLCSDSFSDSFSDEDIWGREESARDASSSTESTIRPSTTGLEGYFLILDFLEETLSDRLARDRNERANEKKHNTFLKKCASFRKSKGTQAKHREAMFHRIKHVIPGIVAGMQYLHSQGIVLRDLKPGNVGFDDDKNIRLFDFGMARRVSECVPDEMCGSPRYMAPEIMNREGYTLKVDVYSFGVLLFEFCTLEVPFSKSCKVGRPQFKSWRNVESFRNLQPFRSLRSFKKKNCSNSNNSNSNASESQQRTEQLRDFLSKVANEHLRPSNDLESLIPCPELCKLIRECWSTDPNERPTFAEIQLRLDAILNSSH